MREENDLETTEGVAQDWRLIKGDYPSADCEGEEPLEDEKDFAAALLCPGKGVDSSGAGAAQAPASALVPSNRDRTAAVADELQIAHPYLLADVEPLNRERVADLRESMHEVCKAEWLRAANGDAQELLPLPVPDRVSKEPYSYTVREVRRELVVSQGSCRDGTCAALRAQLEGILDPHQKRNRTLKASRNKEDLGQAATLAIEA